MALAGLHLTVEQTKAEKYARNERSIKDLHAWAETALGEKIQGPLGEALKDGQVLCRLINKLKPNAVKKINKEPNPFKQRENIEAYLHGCQDLGMSETDCFPVVDLFDQTDLNAVFANLSVLKLISTKLDSNGQTFSTSRNGRAPSGKALNLTPTQGTAPPALARSPRAPIPHLMQRTSMSNADERRGVTLESPKTPPGPSTPTLNESLEAKKQQKYDKDLETELRRWIEAVLGEQLPSGKSFAEVLKDGTLLCRLVNKLKPGAVTKVNEQKTPFKQMENIETYLNACKDLGIAELESFNTVDLYEEKNMPLVLVQLSTLATHAGKIPEWTGAAIFNEKVLGERGNGTKRRKMKKEPRPHRMLKKGSVDSAKMEIGSGRFHLKDINTLGQSVLHVAAEVGLVDFVQWCLAQPGAPDLNSKDKDGYTALASAVSHLRFDMAELLIEAGTDLTITGLDGGTILHSLARLPSQPATVKLVDMVLARKVSLTEIVDRQGDTPLMVAAGNMNDQVMMCLLKRGAAVDKINSVGENALHKACRLVEQDEAATMLCKALIDNGINVTLKNSAGQTAFMLLPPASRAELEKHCDPSAEKLLSPRSVADLRAQRQSQKGGTPRGGHAHVLPDPIYRIELGEQAPLDIELIQMPYHYRWNFAGKKHTNFAGYLDEDFHEAIFISILEEPPTSARVLVRTKDGTIESVHDKVKQPFSAEAVLGDLIAKRSPWKNAVFTQVDNLKLQSDLLDAEERDPQRTFRFPIGVVYSKSGDKTQWDMWNNEHGSKEFEQFCLFLGERIQLKGWTGYTGGLDVKNNTKGSESIFSKFHGFDLMFHISTFLPFDVKDERKLARSRMIGNDITMLIYQEGDTPYAPSTMTGGVSHVFLLVRPVKTGNTIKYSMSCISKDYVPAFKPDIPEPALFSLDEVFRNLIITKLINGHSASQSSPGLKMMYNRPRHAMLANLATVYCKNIHTRFAKEKGKKPKGLLKP